jgi:hypothetical protein
MVKRFLLASGVIVKCVVDGHDGTAGIAEDGFYPLSFQGEHQCLRTGYFHYLRYFYRGKEVGKSGKIEKLKKFRKLKTTLH